MLKSLALAILSICGVAAQSYCEMNDHWVNSTQLPYREGELHPCQYAGTLKTSKPDQDHNLFYWFFKHHDPNAPLVVWINGGPGATSMFGLFLENGPMRITRNGSASDPNAYVLKAAEASWADDYSIVFIDQPVGTGFSYGTSVVQNMQEGSDEFVKFMVEFMTKYPEFRQGEVYLTGESYAGKYLPLFTNDILKWNAKMSYYPDLQVPIQGTLIIDPYTSPVIQRTHMHILPKALGLLDQTHMNQISSLEQKCEFYQINKRNLTDLPKGDEICANIMDYIQTVSGDVFPYDSRIFDYDFNPTEQPYLDYFNKSALNWKAFDLIHIQNSTKNPKFDGEGSEAVAKAYETDNLVDYTSYMNELIVQDYPLIVMAGEFDMQDGIAGQYVWMKDLLYVPENFWNQTRQIWYQDSVNSNETEVAGYWISEGNFSLLTVPKSGHFIPANYYNASIHALNALVYNKTILCQSSKNCSVAWQMCTAMDNCNNRGQCVDGQCVCDNYLYKGANCNNTASILNYHLQNYTRSNFSNFGHNISNQHYLIPKLFPGSNWKVTIVSSVPFDLYVGEQDGIWSNPNPFDFDSQFLNIPPNRNFSLYPENLKYNDGFVILVKQHVYDTINNKLILPFDLKYFATNYYDEQIQMLNSQEFQPDNNDHHNITSFTQIVFGMMILLLLVSVIMLVVVQTRKNQKERNEKNCVVQVEDTLESSVTLIDGENTNNML